MKHSPQLMIKSHAGMRNSVLFAILLGFATCALGQRVSGELRLNVTDATGAGVHATGMIVGRAAGVGRSFETDETGHAIVRGLPLGRYEVTIRSEEIGRAHV